MSDEKVPDLSSHLKQSVDDFIAWGLEEEDPNKLAVFGQVDYARWLLHHFRMSAMHQQAFGPFIADKRLFCTYQGNRYRCTGASRLGDVWLTKDFSRDVGYDKRVDVTKCTGWSDKA